MNEQGKKVESDTKRNESNEIKQEDSVPVQETKPKLKFKLTFKNLNQNITTENNQVKEKKKKTSESKANEPVSETAAESTPKKRQEGAFLAEQSAAVRALIPLTTRKFKKEIVEIPLTGGRTLKIPMWIGPKSANEKQIKKRKISPSYDSKDVAVLACPVCLKIYNDKKSLLACAPATNRGVSVKLSADPKGNEFTYCNGKTNPEIASEYTEHVTNTSVARFSPSGFYMASGDVQGNVRIWDLCNDTHILKYEMKVLSGKINDICWDSESKRICAVGDGKDKYGHFFMFDSGSSVGELVGHSKTINACSFRPKRPFRAVSCSDDFTVNLFHGAPYKFNVSIKDHTRFVYDVKYSPDGNHFVSVGADAKMFMYDGSTGEKLHEFPTEHKGGIYAVSWSPDSSKLLTSSGDKTCKIWDLSTQKVVNTFENQSIGIDGQQMGNLWSGEHLLSVSLNGDINYLDCNTGKYSRTLNNHSKPITAFTPCFKETETFVSGDNSVYWSSANNFSSGISTKGDGHSNQISSMVAKNGKVYSVGMDDMMRHIQLSEEPNYDQSLPLCGSPKDLCVIESEYSVVATVKEICLIKGKDRKSFAVEYSPSAIAATKTEVSVGFENGKVFVYQLENETLTKKTELNANRGSITCMKYSPDGKYLAVGDSERNVQLYETPDYTNNPKVVANHSARVICLDWASDSKSFAVGSLDTNLYVWTLGNTLKSISFKQAHQGSVSCVSYLNDSTIVTTGQDACIKIWNLEE